ncbi:MAG: ECF-type sigma factor [Gemmatimonadales bacterium]
MTADDVAELLDRLRTGDPEALGQLFPLVYQELRERAHHQLVRSPAEATLDTTGLVHETYLKFAGSSEHSWNDRVHFLAVASRAMRQLLVDRARRRLADKRGGGAHPVSLDPGRVPAPERAADMVALDEALERLARLDDRLARTVELRFFGGLTVEETAAVLGSSPRTVKRDWRKARAILYRELRGAS